MKKVFVSFLLLLSFNCFSQQNLQAKYDVDHQNLILRSMNDNAKLLLNESGANSVSIGIVKDGKVYTKHYGEIDKEKRNKATDETLFEIASVTKVFTGTLIANAVLEGKLNLNDDIRKYLGGGYPNLQYKGKPITIIDLQTYKTGIYRDFPDNSKLNTNLSDSLPFEIKKIEDAYDKNIFFEELGRVKLDTFPGTVYKHTKLGPELSALILEKVYNESYKDLLQEKIFDKLRMNSTKLYAKPSDNLTHGYNENNVLMPPISDNLWGAAGLLKSTMGDMVKFIKFELDSTNQLVSESHKQLSQGEDGTFGYSWFIQENIDKVKSYWEQGGAFGTVNIIKVYPKYNLGISIIANQNGGKISNGLFEAVMNLEDDLKPFGKKSIARAIHLKCDQNIDDAIAYYYQLKKTKPDQYDFSDENELNNLGGALMNKDNIDKALKIFTLNATQFPNSGNVYDSRGYAFFIKKDYVQAKKDYEKSLQLDPKNDNAKEMLKKINDIH